MSGLITQYGFLQTQINHLVAQLKAKASEMFLTMKDKGDIALFFRKFEQTSLVFHDIGMKMSHKELFLFYLKLLIVSSIGKEHCQIGGQTSALSQK